ncbi:hypothetical protein CROQUDRAFT_131997 [Cronartium quercuum f. sp. fusiforme G11]|uniref:Uncharacterized protein n=1 Tax=Cronartium quercuum f. sp. fusiforme G11 TaxID=708437 RepID=A0A9P6NLQ8_9BASI|nr:hypothetical protein CROQUDRAFT_131997 [Cronartium quercuum f. sp. fusiforme G11]
MVTEAPERDCLVIYRIIGNDLPPRHSPHQTLTNLKFLLEHESDFEHLPSLIPSQTYVNGTQSKSDLQVELKKQSNQVGSLNVRKYYILNRIANETQFKQVSNLLLNSGVASNRILTIPFEMAEYEKRELRSTRLQGDHWGGKGHETGELKVGLEAIEEDVDLISADEKRRWAMGRLRALDSIYHEKNLYAMNNNGGRNFALTHGRAQADARWVLALDGNCFFTPAALTDLVDGLVEQEARAARTGTRPASHVVVPMSRLLDNREVLVNNTAQVDGEKDLKPMSVEEPQIGFRFSSNATYSNRMRYGRRSKVELLWRLGAIQRNRERVQRTIPEWESDERELITEASYGSIRRDSEQLDFVMAGWVHRLFSGDDRRQEEPTEMAISRRSINRIKGIVWFLEALDQRRLVRQPTIDHPQLFNLNFSQLAELRISNSHASLALKQRIGTLATSMLVNSSDLHRPIHAFVFALTDYLTQQFQFRSKALELIRADLLVTQPPESHLSRPSRASIDPIGYYFPPRPSTTRSGPDQPELSLLPSRLTEPDSTFYLDTISLLFINSSSPFLPQLTSTEIEKLFNTFNAQTDHLIHLQPNPSLHPIQIDLQLAALASFTQNARLLNRILTRTHLRKACDNRPEHLQSDLTIGLGNLDLKPEWYCTAIYM